MKFIVGLVMVFGCVIVGYTMVGGKLIVLWHINEIIIIFGVATGAFLISTPGHVAKDTIKGWIGLLKGSAYPKQRYMNLLGMLYGLFQKARKDGLMGIESDIEEPHESEIFKKYPDVLADHHAMDFICDYMRLVVGGNMNPFELDNLMSQEIDKHHHEVEAPSEATNRIADGMPALGIVAAVLGIVITMGYLNEGPDVIGGKVASALVGTFMGILFAYGVFGPMSSMMAAKANESTEFFHVIKAAILANVQGYTPQIAVEFGRKVMPGHIRPGFSELEEFIRNA
jgi:chemotaxis protein MotA